MRKLYLLLLGVVCFATQALAQRTVTGKVTDEKGAPIANVSVLVRGTTTGTTTKEDGTYSLIVPANAKALVFSSVDMSPVEMAVGAAGVINATLKAEDKTMSEVVVVGYGTQRKKDVTGSVSTITASSIKNIPTQSFDQALSGKAPGLNVVIPNGLLNTPPVVRIRGSNSITGSSFPLIVIDGVPVFTGDISTNLASNNVLGNLNPADIEDIQVLKDASAAAIYGSRAANGVLLITTKKGKSGKAKVSYDVWAGITTPARLFTVMDAFQYVTIKNEALKNANNAAPLFFLDSVGGVPVNTNWLDEVYQNGVQQNHNVNVSGGNESTRYFFSTSYSKQKGILKTNTFDRKQMRMNIDHKINPAIKLGGNFNFSRGTTFSPNSGSLPGTPFATGGGARLAFLTAPNVSPYLPDGRYNIIGINDPAQRNSFNQIGRNKNLTNSGLYNPALIRDLNKISSQSDQILATVYAEITFFKKLQFRTQYGANYQVVEDKTFYNSLNGDGIQTSATSDDGTAFNVMGKYNISDLQSTLTYNTSFRNAHNLSVLAGAEKQRTTSDRWSVKRSGLGDTYFDELQGNFLINDNPPSQIISENFLISYFGRINYNYRNRFYLAFNLRRDGYSALSDANKWGNFGGGSIGWSLSNEKFWTGGLRRAFSTFKLRATYGEVGNVGGLADFASLPLYGGFQYGQGFPTLFFAQAGNPDLKWESSTKFDLGFQFGILNDRINGEITYYKTDLSDLIINVPTPPSMGIPGNSIAKNAASMYNKGIEINLNAALIQKKDFSVNLNVNLTTQKNMVTALAASVPEIVGTTQLERTNITRVGSPLGSFFLIRSGGVDAATGRRIFVNAQGQNVYFDFSAPAAQRYKFADGTIAPAIDLSKDGYIAGNALPKTFGGINLSVQYKLFDLSCDAIYSYGNKVYFGSRAGMLDQRFWNNLTEVMTRWQKPGDITNVPKVVFNDNISNGSAFPIDANLYDGGFLKFRTIALGCTLPNSFVEKVKMSSIRFYVQLLNPFIITKYPGTDPETSVNGNTALTPGVDRNSIGQARTFTAGLNVTF
jgi:TonB-dependent starch-binding outer membrane protein SusC